ncbi:hypothetical protein V8E52_008535 [Russula decolorans]
MRRGSMVRTRRPQKPRLQSARKPSIQPNRRTSSHNSQYVIKGLTEHLHHWEDRGWIRIQNIQLFQTAAFLLKRRSTRTCFTWVKGHNGTLGNEESDRLAKEGAEKDIPEELDLQIPADFDLQGAKLITLDQATAYQGIRERKPKHLRQDTEENLQTTREAIERTTNTRETDAAIWTGTRAPVLRTRVQQFLYKTIHQAYKIGDKWNGVPDCEQRAICQKCERTESMQHILLECRHSPRKVIWRKVKQLWPHGQRRWPIITIGTIMGIGSMSLQDENQAGIARKGQTRLLQILVSEASHLIWVLRCERVIHGKRHTIREIEARWTRKINDRLNIDRITTTTIKRDRNYTRLINATWKQALKKQGVPHEDWLHCSEVFSG